MTTIGAKKNISGNGVVDSNGNIEIDFPPTPSGMVQTGSVTIYDSPSGVQWNVKVSGIQTDVAQGSQTVGGVQVGNGEILTVTGAGLGAFIGQTFHATFAVVEAPEGYSDLITPGHDAYNALTTYTRIVYNQHTLASSIFFSLQPQDRAVIIVLFASQPGDSGGNAVALTSTTAIDYLAAAIARRPLAAVGIATPIIVPVFGAIETQPLRLDMINTSGTQVVVMATPDPFIQLPYNEPEGVVIMNGVEGASAPAIPITPAAANGNLPVQEQGPPHADAAITNTAVSSGSTTFLAVPAAGTAYWIKSLFINAPTVAAAASIVRFQTLSGGVYLCGAYAGAAGATAQANPTEMAIADGISLNNATAVTASGHIVYRLINVT